MAITNIQELGGAQIRSVGINLTREEFYIDQLTTVNNTPVIILSIPVAQNKNYFISVYMMSHASDFSKNNNGAISGSFIRGTGNISRTGSLINNLIGSLAGVMDLVANTATQSIDIKITGSSTSTVWDLNITIIYNT